MAKEIDVENQKQLLKNRRKKERTEFILIGYCLENE